jgi:hypothetical protein
LTTSWQILKGRRGGGELGNRTRAEDEDDDTIPTPMIRAERGTAGAGRRRGDEEDVREREKSRFKSVVLSHGAGGSGIDAGYQLSDKRVAPVVVKHCGRLVESSSTRLKAIDEHKKGLGVE